MTHLLTKSEYMQYLKHPAWLWLKIHDQTKLPPVDSNLQAIFDAGHDFEPYAESLFPGGTKLGWSKSEHNSYGTLPLQTREVIKGGAFAHGQTYVALSRCRTLDGIKLTRPIERSDVIVDPLIVEFINKQRRNA